MRLSIIFFAVCLLISSCQRSSVAGITVDSKLKGYILPKSKVLAGVDFDQLKQTDFYQRHQAQLALPQLNMSDQIGVDLRRDLSYVLVAWDGVNMLEMARGSFAQDAIERHLKSSSTPMEKDHGNLLAGDGKYKVALLPNGIALASSAVLLKQALSENATGGNLISEDMQAQLSRINAGSQAWMVSSGVIPLQQLSMRSDAATALSNISDYINATAIGIKIDTGASMNAHISCISEEGSTRVHDALRGVIGLARLSTRDGDMEQLKMWDAIHVEKQGKEVQVSAELSPALADKLIAEMPALGKRF